jgi:hypothetical protein
MDVSSALLLIVVVVALVFTARATIKLIKDDTPTSPGYDERGLVTASAKSSRRRLRGG